MMVFCFEVGTKRENIRKEVIDWSNFDWISYNDHSRNVLKDLCDEWMMADVVDVDDMATDLNNKIHECVEKVAIKKIVTEHSRPWINKEISDKLKELRNIKRKCRLRKSRANVTEYQRLQKVVSDVIEKSEEEWWNAECEKLSTASESEKWKLINKLTNQSNSSVQPIFKDCNGVKECLFSDDNICRELEEYHICKSHNTPMCDQSMEDEIQSAVSELVQEARIVCEDY